LHFSRSPLPIAVADGLIVFQPVKINGQKSSGTCFA